jgi:hypothetical protein
METMRAEPPPVKSGFQLRNAEPACIQSVSRSEMPVRICASVPLAALLGSVAWPNVARAQDSTARPPAPVLTGAFIGHILNTADKGPVRSADIRLFRVDSTHSVRSRRGADSLEIFVDTIRSRVSATDSTGTFAFHRLEEGHYILQVRRIGFAPLDGVLMIDSGVVQGNLGMQQVSVLAKVMITEMSVDRVKQKLDRVGFSDRYHSGNSGTFIERAEILRRQSLTVADILSVYGIHEGDFVLDRMPTDFDMLSNYPADMVLGIEIYRHGRPIEFNMTRSGPNIMSPGGQSSLMLPLVVIWTFIP